MRRWVKVAFCCLLALGAGQGCERRPVRSGTPAAPAAAFVGLEILVVDLTTGAPVAGAEVAAAADSGPGARPVATTDAAGRARLPAAAGASFLTLRVSRRGYLEQRSAVRSGAPGPIRVVLEPGVPLAGRVEDAASGAPVAGARLALRTALANEEIGGLLESGADGRFEVPGVPAGQRIRVVVRCEGYAPFEVERSVESSGDEWVMRLGRGARIEGTILDAGGFAAKQARVTLELAGEAGGGAASRLATRTDLDGFFRLDGVPAPARGVLVVDGGPQGRARSAFEVQASGEVLRRDLRLAP